MDTNRDTNPYKLKEKEVDWKEREKEATIAELERDHREGNL